MTLKVALDSRCSKCEIVKPVAEFSLRPNGRPQSWCKACIREYGRSYHRSAKGQSSDRKANQRSHALAARDRARELVHGHLATHPCVDCGESDLVVLDFDHLPGSDKSFNIANLINGYRLDAIQAEMDKCEVVCANCHRRRTAKRSGWSKLTYTSGQTGKVACL